MKIIEKCGAQGDVLILRCESIPDTAKEVPRKDGRIIVTHSETGHHHVIEREKVTMFEGDDPLVAWLEIHGDESLPELAEMIHCRPYDTHETIGLGSGTWIVKRQRERGPQGWNRRVMD